MIWRLGEAELAKLGIALAGDNPVKTILTFPGVPKELKGMWEETARGYLEKDLRRRHYLVPGIKALRYRRISPGRKICPSARRWPIRRSRPMPATGNVA